MPLPVRIGMRMPRVVSNQREKFENEEFFRKLNRVSEIKYTGFRDRSIEERRQKFRDGCVQGYTEIVSCTNSCENFINDNKSYAFFLVIPAMWYEFSIILGIKLME